MMKRLFTCALILALETARAASAAGNDPAALGPFGIGSCHTNNRSAEDNRRWIPQMEAIGLRYYRTAHTGWGEVEPEKGRFEWKALDAQLDYLTEHQMTFGGILIGTPAWNTLDKPGSLPVHNVSGWSSYVTATVRHCKSRIKRWEVWNEPPNFTGRDQTPADYAKLVASAYDAAKAEDPDCLIGLAAKSCHVNYLEQVIQAGAKDHFDYITLHPYEILDTVISGAGTEPIFLNIVPCVRKMLAARNPARKDVPVIFTELGCDVSKGADIQAHALIKAYTMGMAQGVACIQWFEGMDGDSGPMGLLDGKGVPRPAYNALKQMILHLGQHPVYRGWLPLPENQYGFVFDGVDGPVLIAWQSQGEPRELTIGQPVSIVDPVTGGSRKADRLTLSAAPALVPGIPEAMVKQAEANKGKPFSWGGDFSKTESVSLTVENGRQVERGLHTLSGDALAKAVVAYGGSARAGSVPGGNVFVVDPGFSSYTTEPLEITVVVRRNEANDNAGFKLDYESTSGLKTEKTGWHTIPDNKEWHTISWRLEDAQFVNYWGYNFSLTSDGNVYNKYYLKSVTVTKVK